MGRLRIGEPGAAAAHGVRDQAQSVFLAHHAQAQAVFHLDELRHFALQHLRHGNPRPARDHARHILFVHFFLEHAAGLVDALELGVRGGEFLPQSHQLAVADLRRFVQVTLARGARFVNLRLLDRFLQPPKVRDDFLLRLPAQLQLVGFLPEPGQLFFESLQALARGGIFFLAQRLALDFELRHAAFDLVDFRRHGIDFNAQAGGGFVNQVDGLVGQEAVGDVTVGEHRGGDDGRILDAHAMVNFVALLQAAQNGDGVFHRRLAHVNGLETPLERRVLLDVLLVFVERGGADAAQFAARQRRLEHVGSVNRTLRRPRTHQGVQFVDEENDLPARLPRFL